VSAGSSAGAAAVPTAVVLARLKAGRRAMASIASLEVPRDCHPLADPIILYATSASGDAAYYLRRVFEAGTNLSWVQLEAIVGSQRHVV
jgi:ubiquinone biosynthesis protein COQ9